VGLSLVRESISELKLKLKCLIKLLEDPRETFSTIEPSLVEKILIFFVLRGAVATRVPFLLIAIAPRILLCGRVIMFSDLNQLKLPSVALLK